MPYSPYKVVLSEGQKETLAKAFLNKTAVTLRLKYEDIVKREGSTLHLTSRQIKKIQKAVSDKRGVDIKMSKTQIKNSLKIIRDSVVLGKGLQVQPPKGGKGMRINPPGLMRSSDVMRRPPPFLGTWGEKK